ncbi:chromodomain protein [Capsaspora owczarzaki ATCC 30864]|nr:chromodomain protein [Capsaspora owczarzaki ATCC 30864]|eukprot:XP_004344365.1 chromodomain protein [Capsaspora owczarzaki ATCC 30864]
MPIPPPPTFPSLQLVLDAEHGVLWMTLDRPKKYNAIDGPLYDNIVRALDYAAQTDGVNIVVLSGNGKYFSSGNDLASMNQQYAEAAENPDGPQAMLDASRNRFSKFAIRFITFPKILVLALNGPAVGIGATIIPHADFVYASADATIYTPFTDLGQSPEAVSSMTFPAIMGMARANEVLILGRTFNANECFQAGLFSAVFSPEEFRQKVQERVAKLADKPPGSLLDCKKLIREKLIPAYLDTNERECNLLSQRWASDECAEALIKFASRRSKL